MTAFKDERWAPSRRHLMVGGGLLMLGVGPAAGQSDGSPQRIGVIGSGHIGATVGALWVKAGHEVLFSSRHPDDLKSVVEPLGAKAKAGTVADAIAFGPIVFVAIPYSAIPAFGRDNAAALAGKIVLDACNPIANRDDAALVTEAKENGVGPTSLKYMPGTHLARAFNALSYKTLGSEGHRSGELLALPIAGSDDTAVRTATALVQEVGFTPVVVPWSQTNAFGPGGPGYVKNLTAPALRQALGLAP